jgi:hypothetical protein
MHLENISPFETKPCTLVGDLAQLPPICKHNIWNNKKLCKSCHIKFTPYWKVAKQHFLSIAMCHVIDLEYLQFFTIIQERKLTTKEIQTILPQFFINKQNIDFEMDSNTTIICTHKITLCYTNSFQSQKYTK